MKKVKQFKLLLLLLFLLIFCSCNDEVYIKKIAYPKIVFPQKKYTQFQSNNFPVIFEYPTYAKCIKEDFYSTVNYNDKDWLNIQMDSLNATIYLTYKDLKKYKLDQLIYESYKFTNKQVYKATSIEDSIIQSNKGYKMIFYTVKGNAASSHQFLITDNKKNFIRGSLYLNSTPNEDSLKIVTDFIKTDILKLMNTLKFKS